MDFRIDGNPDYGALTVRLDAGDTFVGESGAMSYMSPDMHVKARLLGGFFKAVIRKLVAGESLLVGEYSHPNGGEITLSPATPGAIVQYSVGARPITLSGGAFLACTPGVQLSTKFGGLRSFFSGEGMFFLRASGHGELFFNSYGAIVEHEVTEPVKVDTGHIVAWEDGVDYTIRSVGGLKSTFLSGEGLVMTFTGHGKIWLQTRTLPSFAGWLIPHLPG